MSSSPVGSALTALCSFQLGGAPEDSGRKAWDSLLPFVASFSFPSFAKVLPREPDQHGPGISIPQETDQGMVVD